MQSRSATLLTVLCWQVGKVKEGEFFRVETIDWTGGQIKDDDSADDVKNIDLTQARSRPALQGTRSPARARLSASHTQVSRPWLHLPVRDLCLLSDMLKSS